MTEYLVLRTIFNVGTVTEIYIYIHTQNVSSIQGPGVSRKLSIKSGSATKCDGPQPGIYTSFSRLSHVQICVLFTMANSDS